MAVLAPTLFSWQDVESSSDIVRLRTALGWLEDSLLIEVLVAGRKGRRDDYPIVPIWHSLVAAAIFNLPGTAALIRELRRNAELRQVCGFDVLRGSDAVPPDYVYSRFLAKLARHNDILMDIFRKLVVRLAGLFPDFGRRLAADSKALVARRAGEQGADRGVKAETASDGQERVTLSWFGYKLHLLCDTTHELPVAFEVTPASAGDSPRLMALVRDAAQNTPDVLARAEDLAADRAYDDGQDKRALHEDFGITPLIPSRDLARGQMRPLDSRRHDAIYVSPTGEVCCKVRPFDPKPGAAFCPMQYQGYEKDRQTLKFRCPAAAWGVECQNQPACRSRTKDQGFGRVLRIALERDRRLHTPLYEHSREFAQRYKARTAIERMFYRLDHFYGFENDQWGGIEKVTARVAIGLIAMLATARSWIEQGRPERIRSKFQAA